MRKEISNPYRDTHCFFCGRDNQQALKLRFYWDEEKKETSAEYQPAQIFAGQGNMLHGVIQIAMVLSSRRLRERSASISYPLAVSRLIGDNEKASINAIYGSSI